MSQKVKMAETGIKKVVEQNKS